MEEATLLDDVLSFFGLSRLQLEDTDNLESLNEKLLALYENAIDDFNETEKLLIEKKVSEKILQRHRDTVSQYKTTFAEMRSRISSLVNADSLQDQGEAADSLDQLMKGQKLKKSHQKTDPENLPWGTPDADKTRKPAETADELSDLTGISRYPQGTMVAANIITPEMLGQPGGPVAEDLAPTIDVQLTDAIRAKALELEENPVRIYNWVRNNIEFIPSYGSIQGADYTLKTLRGNAFDTASLLIALMRAANIPARYAYGTVEVPSEKVMNWVGGVEVPEAAMQLLGQGGIPNTGVIEAGKITNIKLEHVWVEVWVDYVPSRAEKHIVGDNWIPLDASFKQYEIVQGQDIIDEVAFDHQALQESVVSQATVNAADRYVQGLDFNAFNEAIQKYRSDVENYINSQFPGLDPEELVGYQRLIVVVQTKSDTTS